MSKLAAVILTYNETEHIEACIESLRWADSIIVFDSYSTDDTVQKAEKAGATVIQHPFENYSTQRNAALSRVEAEWVLFVDADERVAPELAKEIRTTLQDPQASGYDIPRHNYIFGKLTRHTGWYPDYQTRLLKRDVVYYDPERQVHELVIFKDDSAIIPLQNPLIHFNYKDLMQFIQKQRKYAKFDAAIWFKDGIRPKWRNYLLQPYRQFKWRFFVLKGYKDGLHGLRLSLLMAWNEFDKYWQLRRLWKNASLQPPQPPSTDQQV